MNEIKYGQIDQKIRIRNFNYLIIKNMIITPYDKYKWSLIWKTTEKAINELKKNKDIEITTHPDYVIWYLTKIISNINNK